MGSARKVMNNIFLVGVIVCFTLAVCLVLSQLFSIVTLNGQLAATVKSILSKPASMAGALACILGFFASYMKKPKE